MSNVVFSPEAGNDLNEAADYIAFRLQNKIAAKRLIGSVRNAVKSLERFPESGTPVPAPGQCALYRYLICGNYFIFYHLEESTVRIDRILSSRRDYLSLLFGKALREKPEG